VPPTLLARADEVIEVTVVSAAVRIVVIDVVDGARSQQ